MVYTIPVYSVNSGVSGFVSCTIQKKTKKVPLLYLLYNYAFQMIITITEIGACKIDHDSFFPSSQHGHCQLDVSMYAYTL